MLYPLSYEGGELFVQVRGYLSARFGTVPVISVPSACPQTARRAVS